MNILAIDYAQNKSGLAWVQTELGVVLPFGLLTKKDQTNTSEHIVQLIETESVDELVFGLPVDDDGTENFNTKKIRAFVHEIQKQKNIPVHFVNERFTTQDAEAIGGEASVDEHAAMIILQEYLANAK